MPTVTGRNEPWPFLYLWCNHFWPKLSILNFCRRRSFKWYPDHSDSANEAWGKHKNAQKFYWKSQSKISCHYTWLHHGENCLSQWRFLRIFFSTASNASPVEGKSLQPKERKTERRKKNLSLLKILISVHARAKMLQNAMLVARKTSCHVVNVFFIRLKLFWSISSLKFSKMPKNGILAKSARSQWVKRLTNKRNIYFWFLSCYSWTGMLSET